MLTNLIAFFSSIAMIILIGIGVVAINSKHKNNTVRKELSNMFANLITTSNTQTQYRDYTHIFANLQGIYYVYKQSYENFMHEQNEAVDANYCF